MAKVAKSEQSGNQDRYLDTVKKLEAKYGIGTIIVGNTSNQELEVVSTGSLNLDAATGIAGLPVGKLIEIFGPESSGKSTITLHIEAGFQKLKGRCILIDFEHSFDKKYATALGVDVSQLTIIQPECMEDGYNIALELIKTGEVRLIVIDSHTAAIPKVVVEGNVGDATIGLQARINSIALGKIKPLLTPNRCTMIGVSQLRTKIGDYGDPEKPTGGNAWKFYSDMRMKVSKVLDKVNNLNKTTVDVIKNKCSAPFGKAEFCINWGTGIDHLKEIIDWACEFGYIQAGGAGWFTIGETKMQGTEKVKQFLLDNPEYTEQLEKDVMEKLKGM